MAVRIILRLHPDVKPTLVAMACQLATLAALVVFSQIIVWTAELLR